MTNQGARPPAELRFGHSSFGLPASGLPFGFFSRPPRNTICFPLPPKEVFVLVRDVMTRGVSCCTRDTDLRHVARLMAEGNIGAIPVVESTETLRPVGIVTDRDITIR